ncbi:MAG: PD-(D/E)XK nuclease domain-containing protein [Solobacterium sp.]|nr:PD-(D/E)XK nuclease domain-containing protein [Solobacterium sp.]
MDEARVAEIVDDVHNSSLAHLKYNSEDSLRYVILLAYIASLNSYTSFQELASGKGFCDILFYPYPGIQKPALLAELKWDKPAEEAISQIKEKNYQAKLKDMHYDGDILFVGNVYDSAGKTHACKIQKQPL